MILTSRYFLLFHFFVFYTQEHEHTHPLLKDVTCRSIAKLTWNSKRKLTDRLKSREATDIGCLGVRCLWGGHNMMRCIAVHFFQDLDIQSTSAFLYAKYRRNRHTLKDRTPNTLSTLTNVKPRLLETKPRMEAEGETYPIRRTWMTHITMRSQIPKEASV